MTVKIFRFDDAVLNAFEISLSPERMATYVEATNGDRGKALHLYTWNTAISAALYGPLQGLEVALRNAMHQQLGIVYGENWYDNLNSGLDAGALDRIDAAKKALTKSRYAVISPPRVVAELSFGFWVSLLGKGGRGRAPNTRKKNYDMALWREALHKAFPHSRKSRVETHRPLDYLRTLRNRVAHHEPIFKRHIEADFSSILEVTGWICPETALWIERHSRIKELLDHGVRNDGRILF